MLPSELSRAEVEELARRASGRPDATVTTWSVTSLPVTNLTTGGLARISGLFADGPAWSLFAKTLRPVEESEAWAVIPEEHHDEVRRELNWLDEPRVYRSGLTGELPDGLRFPTIVRIDEGERRLTIWMEDVGDEPGWDTDRYRRTARLLGRLSARCPASRAASELGLGLRPLDRLFHGKISHLDLVVQADDGFWRQPSVSSTVDGRYRSDLGRLAELAPSLLQHLHRLPCALAHGDAAPSNFREPADGSTVALDWSYASIAPLGSDLAQLVSGRFESGEADPATLAEVTGAVLDGYVDGLRTEGSTVDAGLVEEAFVATLAIRSVFSLLLVERGPGATDEEHGELLRRRAALGRYGLDLALNAAW